MIALEWVLVSGTLFIVITAAAILYAVHARSQTKYLLRYAHLQRSVLLQMKSTYADHGGLNVDEDSDKVFMIHRRIDDLAKKEKRRDFHKMQVNILDEVLSIKDTSFRNVLLRRLAEVCIDRGSIDIGKTSLSHISDGRVLENCSYLADLEHRRISRLNLASSSIDEVLSDAAPPQNVTILRR